MVNSSLRTAATDRVARQPLAVKRIFELRLAADIAEYHLMPGSCEDGSELAAHEPGTQTLSFTPSPRTAGVIASGERGDL